ncbi:MAG: hypothetical protein R6W78_19070 [Bacteroidales bacterium]
MKTKHLLISAIILAHFLFNSCEKEKVDNAKIQLPVSDFSVKVENNKLVFPTVSDYEKAITYLGRLGDENFDLWEQSIGFKSMRTEIGLETDTLVKDPLLGTLINKDYEIVIQGYNFKLNLKEEKVEVSSVNSDLKSTGNSELYSTNVDLLDKIFYPENYKETTEPKLKGWFHDKDGTYRIDVSSGSHVKVKLVYQKAAIYFSLLSDIKHVNHSGCGGNVHIGYQYQPGCFYWKKGNNNSTDIPEHSDGGDCREYDRRPYHGGRGLKDYYLSVKFWISDYTWGKYPTITLTIDK